MHPYQALAGLVFCVLMNSVRAFVRLSRSSSVAKAVPGAGWARMRRRTPPSARVEAPSSSARVDKPSSSSARVDKPSSSARVDKPSSFVEKPSSSARASTLCFQAHGLTAGARRSVAVGAHAVDCMCEACSNICKAAYGPCDCARCVAGLAKTACLPGCAGCDLCATLAACAPGCAGCDNCR